MAGSSNITGEESIIFADNVSFDGTERGGKITTNGQLLIGSTTAPHIRVGTLTSSDGSINIATGAGTINLTAGSTTPDTFISDSGSATPSAGNLNVLGQKAGSIPVMATNASGSTVNIENRAWPSKFIVDSSTTAGLRGTYSTIASAITDASSGDTIFIRPGTYTENLTLKAGVNLTSFPGDGFNGSVIISGNCTLSSAGTVTISGIRLQTNSGNIITVSGNAASILNLIDCNLNCTNNTGISYSSSSASSAINTYNCIGDLGTTGIALFAHSSSGTLTFNTSFFTNSGGSSTASTISAGVVLIRQSRLTNPITGSGTSQISFSQSNINTGAQNATCVTFGGSGSNTSDFSNFTSGTASAISISASCTLTIHHCNVSTSNANAITGAGTIHYSGITFSGSSTTINTTTQTTSGTLQGSKNTAPTAGMLGEQLTAAATTVSMTSNTDTNITSISVTAGIWDISANFVFNATGNTVTDYSAGISTTSATQTGDLGNQRGRVAGVTTTVGSIVIPVLRATLSSTTTYYLVGKTLFGSGTCNGQGRISATRVG